MQRNFGWVGDERGGQWCSVRYLADVLYLAEGTPQQELSLAGWKKRTHRVRHPTYLEYPTTTRINQFYRPDLHRSSSKLIGKVEIQSFTFAMNPLYKEEIIL